MLVEVKVPPLAESVSDATLMTWRKRPGDPVRRGDPLIDLETDKVTLEVTSPEDGVIREIVKQDGETAVSNDVLAVIDTEAPSIVAGPAPVAKRAEPLEAPPSSGPAPLSDPAAEPDSSPSTARPASAPKLSPAVRKLIAEKGVDPGEVPPSGRDGRITRADVLSYVESRETQPPPAEPAFEAAKAARPSGAAARPEERVPMTRLRKRTAERLLEAQHNSAILTTFNEVDMQPVISLRERYRTAFEERHGIKLGFMSFFAKACVEALKKFPVVNASVDGDAIVYHGYYDLGIAVSAPRGLVVPVLRDVDQLSFAEIETRLRDLGTRAREGTLTLEELTGGTFTITNGGIFGSLLSTPILNPPQSAILGMHSIQDRPVAQNGTVVVRPMMYLALSYDHRIIDGREAVQFLVAVKESIEDPSRLLLGL